MNIFEDLIEELKEENLLEKTVNEPERAGGKVAVQKSDAGENMAAKVKEGVQKSEVSAVNLPSSLEVAERENNEAEFYRKRAKNEVSFLQMVEHVFAGVEREQLKIVPKPYDDLEVKKVLHSFLQISHAPHSSEHASAHFRLLEETERWHSSLALRNERLLTAQLRRYCETSRPPLSSPALISLARFYRNSTYSEQVRSKFDLVLTRLLSKEIGGNQRELVLARPKLAAHLIELYAEWSSVPLYSTDTGDAEIAGIAQGFEDFIIEADEAGSFDELIESSFFNRLHLFKKSTNENFFAPLVAAAAVESNIRIGNRYVELLVNEKEKGGFFDLKNKYGAAHDQTVSEATGKTLAVAELLNQKTAAPPSKETLNVPNEAANRQTVESAKAKSAATVEAAPQFDKRLIVLAGIAVLLLVIIYQIIG
ncbi:MAG: hypothetical protein LH614_15955 [Pyrinomonadaceae bacterium]|nr:hypothetical protein [Pyrinomonadaceae bacterium]